MKKLFVFTSLFALAACGGGGGGSSSPASPRSADRPLITVQAFDGGTTVNADNSDVTNMSSYTLKYGADEDDTKQAMIDYVVDKLGSTTNVFSRHAATTRSGAAHAAAVASLDFARADAALKTMKQVIYDLVTKSGDETELTNYVTRYKDYVAGALQLAEQDVADDASVEDLITAFNTYKTANSLTPENVIAKMDTFDETKFNITKITMDNVLLRDTGTDAYFKFKLDETGTIESISLWENRTSEYGSGWTDASINHRKKIVINGSGDAELVTVAADASINPFDAAYKNSGAGDLNRDETNGNEFKNILNHYEFDFGEYDPAVIAAIAYAEPEPSSSQITNVQNIISTDKFEEIEIDSLGDLSLAEAKAKLKEYILEKVNKVLHSQDDNSVNANYDANTIIAVANYYIDQIDTIDGDDVTVAYKGQFKQIATLNGMGKDVKLQYSDFGYAKKEQRLVSDDSLMGQGYLMYAGGYDERRMDNTPANNNLATGATFKGTAVVTVEHEYEDRSHANPDFKHTALFKDDSATLVYSYPSKDGNATHTLTMSGLKGVEGDGAVAGTDWYAMTVSGTENNSNITYTFNENGKTILGDYKFFNDKVATNGSDVVIDMIDGTTIDANHSVNGSASAEYYGADKKSPTEATAGFWMDERYYNGSVEEELSVYGAFGGKKQ